MQKIGDLHAAQDLSIILSSIPDEQVEEEDLISFLSKLDEKLKKEDMDPDTYNKMKAVLNKDLEEVRKKLALAKEREQRR